MLYRAKLYKLGTQGRWHDLGTGHFMIEIPDDEKPKYKMTLK